MQSYCVVLVVLLSQLAFISVGYGANIDMFVNTSAKVTVNKDLSSTYGLKFCLRSTNGVLLTFGQQQGVYNVWQRFQVEIGNTGPDNSCIRYIAASSAAGKNYQTDLVNFSQQVCFWVTWADNWYFVGSGSVWGENLLMNFRNLTVTPIGGVFASTKSNGQQAYLTIIDEDIPKASAQTYAANSLYVAQVDAGPVSNAVTAITTTNGGAYQDLGVDLSSVTYFSFTQTTNNIYTGGWIALYDKNNPDFTNNAYEFNCFRYDYAFYLGRGIGKPMVFNLNIHDYVVSSNGTVRECWLSWANGRIAAGVGHIVGVNPVILWNDPVPLTVNAAKIRSADMNVNWNFPTRYF